MALQLESVFRMVSRGVLGKLCRGCIVLNRPLTKGAVELVQGCDTVIACDGGANHLMDAGVERVSVIIGDMDSLSDEAKERYTRGPHGDGNRMDDECSFVDLSDDQETTDFEKAINYFLSKQSELPNNNKSEKSSSDSKIGTGNKDAVVENSKHNRSNRNTHDTNSTSSTAFTSSASTFSTAKRTVVVDYTSRPMLVVVGALQGRLDHMLQQLNVCLKFVNQVRLVLVSDESVAEVIPPVLTNLQIDPTKEGRACGIVPFNKPAKGTTTGLVWNLSPVDELELEWGGLLSTSNLVEESTQAISFHMSSPVLWTIELKK
eukprot:m.243332 g.243332  ORF g.243332 m.243332 type:complete len:318 (-) comp43021_c0_seq1:129-1082(-)